MLSAESRAALRALPVREGGIRLMEVCGTHTMSIARAGLRRLLPEGVELLSGPGCPVCVTHQSVIDAFLTLSGEKGVTIASYGDMLRVPGSTRGDSLSRRRALGAEVLTVYSPMDALDYAAAHPEREVVFLGVGFETTAPGTAVSVLTARERGVMNFSVFSMLKRVEPALRALCAMEELRVDGFLCPGHVAVILGTDGFAFLPNELQKPAVIGGFEPEDILRAVCRLIDQVNRGEARVENEYRRVVTKEGNTAAKRVMACVLTPRDERWRGLGEIAGSGLALRAEFAAWDAEKKFGIVPSRESRPTACRCGDVMKGAIRAKDCPLFGGVCTPDDPVGPCMVSSEGACAAAWKYGEAEL